MILAFGGVGTNLIPFPFLTRGGGPPNAPTSDCGAEFDAYIKEAHGRLEQSPFMFEATSRVLELWKGRRLRFYRSENDFVEAKVVQWKQSENSHVSDNFPFETSWELRLEGDLDLNPHPLQHIQNRDRIQVTIRDKPKAHEGKTGHIVQFLQGDRYKIQLDHDPLMFVTTHKDNVIRKPSGYCFYVYRMNVHGGGILRDCVCGSASCRATQYSIEWIDSPFPAIDQFRSVAKATCPTCRAIEPTPKAFDDRDGALSSCSSPEKKAPFKKSGKASQQQDDCCPICDMQMPLRTLQCNHQLCQDCWSKWRVSATSMMPFDLTQPPIDARNLQKERDRGYQKMKALLPHTLMDGTATRKPTPRQLSSNSEQVNERNEKAIEDAMEKFFERLGSILCRLDDTVHAPVIRIRNADSANLKEFWSELRKAPVHIFCFDGYFKDFLDEFYSMAGLEIICNVIQERSKEIEAARWLYLESGGAYRIEADGDASSADGEDLETKVKGYLLFLMALCHTRMAELHEDDNEYYSAIFWYERAISSSLKRLELEGDSSKHARSQLAVRYNNLGLATKRAGKLTEAGEHYDTAIEYTGLAKGGIDDINFDDTEKVNDRDTDYVAVTKRSIDRNRCTLNKEFKLWTGTSGRLTPGC
jgi:tetratricopeptide (TPR) repeat protein